QSGASPGWAQALAPDLLLTPRRPPARPRRHASGAPASPDRPHRTPIPCGVGARLRGLALAPPARLAPPAVAHPTALRDSSPLLCRVPRDRAATPRRGLRRGIRPDPCRPPPARPSGLETWRHGSTCRAASRACMVSALAVQESPPRGAV